MEKTIIFLVLLVAMLIFIFFLALSQRVASPSLEYSSKVGKKVASRILWLGSAIYLIVFAVLCCLSPVAWYLILTMAVAWAVFFMSVAFFSVKLWIAAWPALLSALSLFVYFVAEIKWVAVIGGAFCLSVVVAIIFFKRHDN